MARADNSVISVTIVPQSDSPILINDCAIRTQDTVAWNNGTQVNATAALVGMSFTNTSDKTAVAVKFSFRFADAFGDLIFSSFGENSGTYSTGAIIKPKLGGIMQALQAGSPGVFTVTFAGTGVSELACSVSAVRFDDGTTWHAKAPTPQSGGGTPLPRPR
jgi:hypothetical protein